MKFRKCLFYKWLLVIGLIVLVENGYAQQRYYCEVKGIGKLTYGLKIIFDFGTQASYNRWGINGELKFVDDDGKEMKFNSMIDAANYMVHRGWHFQQAYSSVYAGSPVVHWIFYKDAESVEEAQKGIMTKAEYKKKIKDEEKKQ